MKRALLIAAVVCSLPSAAKGDDAPLREAIAATQAKVVKIYGAGGVSGLEHYQSGAFISKDGHVLTAWSTVLDSDEVTVVTAEGRELSGKLVGADVRLELAVLKVDLENASHFDLSKAADVETGTRVIAVSNLYNVATGDEPASAQQGWIAAKTTLAARRGAFDTPYAGPIYVLDAITNNPGAAGGVVVDAKGSLVGVIGKELRSRETNTWLNYALPANSIAGAVADLAAGKGPSRGAESPKTPEQAHKLADLGIVLVPDAVPRTPPYVDRLVKGSSADRAGIRPDDLIVMVGERLAASCQAATKEVAGIDRADPVKLTLMRGQELVEIELLAAEGAAP